VSGPGPCRDGCRPQRWSPGPARQGTGLPPASRITTVGHPLLGVTAGWELFARGPDDVLRIEPALGRIDETYVPSLETASPDVAFVVGPHSAVIRRPTSCPDTSYQTTVSHSR
jgi:hypothetical protein